eukprot:3387019-Pleurochrysis_carterae.AAC.2
MQSNTSFTPTVAAPARSTPCGRCLRVLCIVGLAHAAHTHTGRACAGRLGVRVRCGAAYGVQLDVLVCDTVRLDMRVRGAP